MQSSTWHDVSYAKVGSTWVKKLISHVIILLCFRYYCISYKDFLKYRKSMQTGEPENKVLRLTTSGTVDVC